MLEDLAKAVARELYRGQTEYPTQDSGLMWEVLSDTEKALCRRIAAAVLDRLRQPSADMLRAADTAFATVIEELKSAGSPARSPDDAVRRMFSAMIEAAGAR